MKNIANGLHSISRAKRIALTFAACALFSISSNHEAFGQWVQSAGYNNSDQMKGFFAYSSYLLVDVQASNSPPASIDSLFGSTNNGQTWFAFEANGGIPLTTAPGGGFLPDLIGGASYPSGGGGLSEIMSYSPGTTTWLPDTLGFPTINSDYMASSLVTIGSGSTVFAADGSFGVYQQTAPGAPWTPDTVGMTVAGTPYPVSTLFVSGNNIFAGTSGGGILVSTNQGTLWTPINSGLTAPLPGWLGPGGASFALSGTTLFAMIPNNGFGFDTLYNFYSLGSDGKTWTLMNATPLKGGVGVITNFAASSNVLFAAHDSVVNFSNDNGATWHQGTQGLPTFAGSLTGITSVCVSGSNLVIGILGAFNEIWYCPLSYFASSSVTPSNAPASGLTLALSGNPASGSPVTVSYTVPSSGIAEVTLMDALGREVRVLQNGRASAGQNVVTIDPLTIAPGSYFVRVEANGSSAMQKLVITR